MAVRPNGHFVPYQPLWRVIRNLYNTYCSDLRCFIPSIASLTSSPSLASLNLNTMLSSILISLSLLAASVAASPTPAVAARAATSTVYMRIEGPTKTIYEQTIHPTVQNTLTNNGHTATCKSINISLFQLPNEHVHDRQRYA